MSEADTTPEADLSEDDKLAAALAEGETESQEEAEDDGLVEVEVGPERLRVPKPIKEAWDGMQRAHTEKSEKVAGERREIEKQEKEIQERVKIVQSFPREIAKVTQLQEQIESYQKVDWATLRMNGEMVRVGDKEIPAADYHWGLFQNAQAQFQSARDDLSGKISAEQAKRDGAFAQQKTAYHQEMASKVKDWSPQKDQEIRDYAVKRGAPKEVVDTVYHPALMMFAHDSMVLAQLRERAKANAKTKAPDETPLEPPRGLKTGNGKPRATLETARSPEEYQKIRLKQMAEGRAARVGR